MVKVSVTYDHLHRATGAAENVDGRKPPCLREFRRQRDVSVEERPRRIADRISFFAIAKDRGDQRDRPKGDRSRDLYQACQLGKDAWRIPPAASALSGGYGNLACGRGHTR
jgi:hypothetical protein